MKQGNHQKPANDHQHIGLMMSVDVVRQLAKVAGNNNTSKSEVIRNAVEQYLQTV